MLTLKEAAQLLKRGGLVGFPTESFFALGADATNASAVRLLFTLKARDRKKPVALIAADFSQVKRFFTLSAAEIRLARRSWPGSLTLILRPKKTLASIALGARRIGVRVPPHAGARQLAARLGRPVTATSLNISGEPPTKSRAVLTKKFPGLQFMNGPCGQFRQPSTVVRVSRDRIDVVRPGAVQL